MGTWYFFLWLLFGQGIINDLVHLYKFTQNIIAYKPCFAYSTLQLPNSQIYLKEGIFFYLNPV